MTTEALLVHMARDVAGIVRGYLGPVVKLMRPFRASHCMVCGKAHRRVKTNLCNAHADLCGLCGGPHNKYSERGYNCAQCTKDFQWMDTVVDRQEHLMARLYRSSDEIDIGKFNEIGAALRDIVWPAYVEANTLNARWLGTTIKNPIVVEECEAARKKYMAANEAYYMARFRAHMQLVVAMEAPVAIKK